MSPLPRGSSMKLRLEDMPLFGLCPSQDEFYLVVCEHCEQVIKPQALRSHIESRHPHSLEHRWSDSPTPASVVSGGGGGEGRSGDGAASRLSANPSPTPDGSTASSSLSAGGPSSRSTPSPKRSDSAGKTAYSPSLRSLLLLYTIRLLLGKRPELALFVRDGIPSDADYNSTWLGVVIVVVVVRIFTMG